ncbi:MAG: dihydroorotase [Clostridia bacterium]|nr:dihydroorotase [Clostridia bacterium]
MDYILKNAIVYTGGELVKKDLAIKGGIVCFSLPTDTSSYRVIDCLNRHIFPGFVDVHVHLREPGFSYKETIKSGTTAAAASGYSAVFSMPNLKPVPDSVDNLKIQQEIIDKDAVISVYPMASITKGQKGEELSDMEELSNFVLSFSDDGVGVQDRKMMEKAMRIATRHGKVISAHCEDNTLLNGGYIHDGKYAKLHNHKGISSASEYKQVKRDISLADKIGVKYHVCHVSTKGSVEAIRKAKDDGIDVTAETAPHYLVFNDMMLKEHGAFKMNPPIRSEKDRQALIEGIKDGTIDMIATDHAPHTEEEKNKGLLSLNGIVGLETAFPIIYTELVRRGTITLERAIELMSVAPAERFGLNFEIADGKEANLAVFDLVNEYEINSSEFKSKGKCSPFDGRKVFGKCLMNFHKGNLVFEDKKIDA